MPLSDGTCPWRVLTLLGAERESEPANSLVVMEDRDRAKIIDCSTGSVSSVVLSELLTRGCLVGLQYSALDAAVPHRRFGEW